MSETITEVALRCGIPEDKIENLVEHPEVAKLLVEARDSPNIAPEAIMAQLELPVADPDGLDIEKLELELEEYRKLWARGDGTQTPAREQRINYPMVMGRMEREINRGEHLRVAAEQAAELLGQVADDPANINRARRILVEAVDQYDESGNRGGIF